MRLRHLFEAPEKRIVAIMPGGFHPFHPGHKSLYDWAVETFGKENVYVAATNDTKSRPFPFDVKIKLAQMAGVPANRFIQVKSPFNALSYKDIIGDAAQTALVFVRSEKDKSSHPLPDQIRKSDGNMGYLISYKGNNNLETADTHGYMAYGPTIDFNFSGMSIKSASELRASWPEMSDEDKLQAADLMYPGNGQTATKLLNQALGVKELEPANESDLVLDRSNLIDYIRDKIIDYVNSEEDLDKLANLLKSLVGKTVSSRGKRFTVSDFDVESVIEACKRKRKSNEDSPPGREKQVKALKKEFPDDEGAPYAIAWAQHNKHGKPKRKSRG